MRKKKKVQLELSGSETAWRRIQDGSGRKITLAVRKIIIFSCHFPPDSKYPLRCVVWLQFFTTFLRTIHWKWMLLYILNSTITPNACEWNWSFHGFNIFGQLFNHCWTSSNELKSKTNIKGTNHKTYTLVAPCELLHKARTENTCGLTKQDALIVVVRMKIGVFDVI